MISNNSSHRLVTTTTMFGVVSLLFAFNAGNALGGDALGGVAGAVAGAVGAIGGALGGGGDGPPGGAGGSDGASTGAVGVGAQSGRGMAIGKKRLKRIIIVEDGELCGNTLYDFPRRHNCNYQRTTPDEADGDNVDQASYSPVDEPLIRKPKSKKRAGKLQPPVRKKATAPKSTARLNVERPSVEKPKLTVDPKLIKPNGVEKAQPKSDPTLSCDKAGIIVGGYGFTAIKSSDCDGRVYAFNASRDGKSFTVTLNAVSGELIEVRKVP